MTAMPHLTLMQWDFQDQLQATARQVLNEGTPETTYYVYDAAGQRVRKVTERQNGTRKNERSYLGGFEMYREYDGNGISVSLERESLHVMDDQQRIALVETRTQGNDGSPAQLIRYQFSNHLGSASLELDDQAQIISYEEYHPYGSTSYQARRSMTETPKRFRYSGKERDEETGFAYYGFRYYASGLGRWISTDPTSLQDGLNLYCFTRANPVTLVDLVGTDSDDPWETSNRPAPPTPGQLTMVEDGFGLDAEGRAFVRNAHGIFEDATIARMRAEPAIASPIVTHRLALQGSVALGLISQHEASRRFRAFIKEQVYSYQKELGGSGFCAAASRQMALKHAGVISLGLSYGQIKRGLKNETSVNASTPGKWEYWHFNETTGGKFSEGSKLHPDAIAQIQRNASVGTRSTDRLQWTHLTSIEARRFLDEGAMVVVGTSGHWMTAVHDPFTNEDLFVDPYATGQRDDPRIVPVRSKTPASMHHPIWKTVLQYHGLARVMK
jgi:RHS repeat-associated protein